MSIYKAGQGGNQRLPVEGPRESEIVIAGEFTHARVKLAIVDEAAGFVDYEERKDNPMLY